MGTRYSTLDVGQSYIMLRVFEDADNNSFAAILHELDPPCPHATPCAQSRLCAQGHAEAQEMPKMDFGMAVRAPFLFSVIMDHVGYTIFE